MVTHCNERYESKERHSGWTGTIALQGANTRPNEEGEGNYVPKWESQGQSAMPGESHSLPHGNITGAKHMNL